MRWLVVLLTRALGIAASRLGRRRARAPAAGAGDDLSRNRLLFLAEATTELERSLDYQTTLESLARLTVPGMADLCIVDMVAPDRSLHRVAVTSTDALTEPLAREMTRRRPLMADDPECAPAVVRTGTPHLHPDLDAAGNEGPDHAAILGELGVTSIMVVPLVSREETLGAVTLASSTSGRRYRSDDVELAEDLARRAALALDNARQFGESQARIREAETLLAVSRTLSSTLDPTERMRRVAREIARALTADMVGAFLADPAHEHLRPIAGYHVPKDLVEKFLRFPIPIKGHLAIEEAWQTRRAVWTSDMAADPRVDRASLERFPHQSDLFVPMIAKGAPVGGFFVIWWKECRRPTPEEIRLVEGICDQAGMLVDNARLYSEATRRQREAEAAYEELSRTQASLVRAETLRALGELASGAAHHLNNLLTIILGRVQLARERREPSEIQRLLTVAERATLDAADVVRRMGGFSRTHLASAPAPVHLNEVVAEVLELTRPRWHDEAVRRGARIEARGELQSVPAVMSHAPALREALMNLVLNAIDALSSEGGGIVIKTWATGERVYCAVADTGAGMPEVVQQRALEPFFTTKGPRNTGLGLSVTCGIIQQSGGELAIDSAEGRGTTVTFHLPVATVAADAPRPLPASPVPSLRILLIDDQMIVRTTVAEILSSFGATVVEAESGREGLAHLEHGPAVDLVLTDLGMPGMTGWAVARAVKARYPSLTVGLITGWSEDPDASPEDRAAVDLTLTKPLTVEALRSAVARLQPPNLPA